MVQQYAVAVDFKTGKLILENAETCRVDDRLEIIPRKLSQLKNYIVGRQFDYIFLIRHMKWIYTRYHRFGCDL